MSDERRELIEQHAGEVNAMWRNAYPNGRDPKRIDRIIEMLRATWKKYPDYRLGQLVSNITERNDPFHIEDDVMAHLIAAYGAPAPSTQENPQPRKGDG